MRPTDDEMLRVQAVSDVLALLRRAREMPLADLVAVLRFAADYCEQVLDKQGRRDAQKMRRRLADIYSEAPPLSKTGRP